MSNIVKDIFSTTDKLNFLTNTTKLTKFVSKFEKFETGSDNETDEERRKRFCRMIIVIRVLFIVAIAFALAGANANKMISDELFMGLLLLTLLMPDLVLVILIILSVANHAMKDSPSQYSATSSEQPAGNLKYSLTSTPDVFN
jgi:hypothetical protein